MDSASIDPLTEPIAIIGSGCRFPGGVNSPSQLWDLLETPSDVTSRIPSDRWHPGRFGRGIAAQESYFLTDPIDRFDAQFFGISPTEAEAIDPQQRLLLEVVYEALEAAGVAIETVQGSHTAVYVGQLASDYKAMTSRDITSIPTYHATGTAGSHSANRLSYFFDWHGPSITLDTACSSSLVALHLAVQQLRTGTSAMAVAAGTQLLLDPTFYMALSNLNMVSPTARCQMWDAKANGYVRADGVAAVILKPLRLALQDGDHIECIIRETGVNQDGRTTGITMPSARAQEQLIRETYHRAGLDLAQRHVCQYFEAHGTGTQAGDLQEAQAIAAAFFNHDQHQDSLAGRGPYHPLWVGSVKTVLGHSEATAGLASILKVSAALQHQVIPPNLHFDTVNPSLKPFLNHLRIATTKQPWPEVPPLSSRRASVNSFGYGGTNAHAIVEAAPKGLSTAAAGTLQHPSESTKPLLPLVFSASTKKALTAMVQAYRTHLNANPEISLNELAFTLCCRRSVLPFKAAFSASTVSQLCGEMSLALENAGAAPSGDGLLGTRSRRGPASILGVFTGQGAQWPQMGLQLLRVWPAAQQRLRDLDEVLQGLPARDRPAWGIGELFETTDARRVNDAVVSQTLCTALQIVLVELLAATGIRLKAVVGHSSGEIAAAYAAGYLSAAACITIAYYRGLHVTRAAQAALGQKKVRGAMVVVSITFEAAMSLCQETRFRGRISVAASNSATSTTLSGDEDAVAEVEQLYKARDIFVRRLRVDTAYHSAHMLAVAEPYTQSLEHSTIPDHKEDKSRVLEPAPAWFSSVHSDGSPIRADGAENLRSKYWVDNMTGTVHFMPAIIRASTETGPFDMVLEIGPHQALKGPVSQILKEVENQKVVPYLGLLSRGKNDREAFSSALGQLWTNLGPDNLSWNRLAQQAQIHGPPLKNLPTYPWDHEQSFWSQSRVAERFRTDETPFHALLGVRVFDGPDDEWRWRNVLKPKQLSWLLGHRLEDKPVLPPTTYLWQALEAAQQLPTDRPVSNIDVLEMDITSRTSVDETWGVETVVTLSDISHECNRIRAHFTSHSAPLRGARQTERCASAVVEITLGDKPSDLFIPACMWPETEHLDDLTPVNVGETLDALDQLGYSLHGPFQGILQSIHRQDCYAVASLSVPASSEIGWKWLSHMMALENAMYSIFAASCTIDNGRPQRRHVLEKVGHLRFAPAVCGSTAGGTFHASARVEEPRQDLMVANLNLFNESGSRLVALDDLRFAALDADMEQASGEGGDRFFETVLGVESPDASLVLQDLPIPEKKRQHQQAIVCQRMALYYARQLNIGFHLAERAALQLPAHHTALLDFCAQTVHEAHYGIPSYIDPAWLLDSPDVIDRLYSQYEDQIDVKVIRTIGENLPAVLRGKMSILEVMHRDNLLEKWHLGGMSFARLHQAMGDIVQQVRHRSPAMDVLEIEGATGGSVAMSLCQPCAYPSFASYTYTTRGNESLTYESRMEHQVLDISLDPTTQGFATASYDLVVGRNILQATPQLQTSLRHLRSLLRPGGHLILTQITGPAPLYISLACRGLLGPGEGQFHSPTGSLDDLDRFLRASGFSGIDTHTPIFDPVVSTTVVLVSQAVDERIAQWRRPGRSDSDRMVIPDLVVLGGASIRTRTVVDEVLDRVGASCGRVRVCTSWDKCSEEMWSGDGTVLNLMDMDSPVLQDPSPEQWKALQGFLTRMPRILWVTPGHKFHGPYTALSVGLLRSVACERKDANIQVLDLDLSAGFDLDNTLRRHGLIGLVVDCLLRLHLSQPYPVEPELVVRDGRLYVPRLIPATEPNLRLKSAQRTIRQNVSSILTTPVRLRWADSGYVLSTTPPRLLQGQDCTVHLSSSVLSALTTPSGNFFVSVGRDIEYDRDTVVLSKTLSSTVCVPRAWSWPVPDDYLDRPGEFLHLISARMLSRRILSLVPHGANVMVHDATMTLAATLREQAQHIPSVRVSFSTGTAQDGLPADCIILDSNISLVTASLRRVSVFVDLSPVPLSARQQAMLNHYLPEYCQRIAPSLLFSKQATVENNHADADQSLVTYFRSVVCWESAHHASHLGPPPLEWGYNEVPMGPGPYPPLSMVVWRGRSTVPEEVSTIVQPSDEDQLFCADRTYWLVGFTAALTCSICNWMASRGAQVIVVTNEENILSAKWKERCLLQGVRIEELPSNLTSSHGIHNAYRDICRKYPPIGGIISDTTTRGIPAEQTFDEMDVGCFRAVLHSKLAPVQALDALFTARPLDFFVVLSSSTSITGSVGHTADTTAGMFVQSLIAQRQRRGLVGSVVEIASGDQGASLLGSVAPSSVSQLLAETIRAGQSGTILMAARLPTVSECSRVPEIFQVDSRYSPLLARMAADRCDDDGGSGLFEDQSQSTPLTNVPTCSQPVSTEQSYVVIRDGLITQTSRTLNLPREAVDDEVALVELGIDSLTVAEIRAWLLEEVGMDISVLRILDGMTIQDLVQEAIPARGDTMPTKEEAPGNPKTMRIDTVSTEEEPTSPSADTVATTSKSLSSPEGTTPPSSLDGRICETPQHERVCPTSVNQKRIWFGTQYMKDPCHGNMALLYEAIGKGFDVKRFQSALDKVVQRHPQLRTAFFQEAKTGELLQGQLAASRGLSTLHSLQTDADEEEGLVHRVYRQQASHVWRLAEGEVVRTTIVSRPSTGQHWVIFGFHHLVMDGMSWKIFLQDLDCAYRQQPFRRMPGHYMDYAADVNDRVPSAQELAYWAQELQDFSPDPMPLLPWARVRSRKVTDNYEARMHQRRLDPDLVHRVTKTSRLLHGSPAHFYLAAMQIVLARVLGLRQLWVGMVDANRRDDRFRDTLGCFLNDLPLRLELNTDEPFADVFKRVSRTILRALQNSHAPLEVILDRFQVPRSPIHAPLFQVVFNYRMNDYLDAPLGDDARLQYVDWVQVGNAYDMGIALGQSDNNQCVLEVAYRDYLYTREDMDLFMDLYVNVLEAFADHPASAVQDGRLYSPAQVDRAIQTGLGPQGDVSWQPATLPARFDTMAAAYADDVAVIDDSGSFTYAQLVDRIQQIARGIMAHGPIRPGARIAVRCWPSVDVVAAMFAIQRLGAVYVPLDMSLPAARHQAILADCQPALLCCHDRSGLAEISLPESSWQVYDLTTVPWPESGPSLGHDAIPDQSMASSAACLFYTSGSTGTPKGILLAHAGLVNTLAAKARDFPLHRATVLQQSSLGFDMALSQMACALLNGGTVVMVPQHARGDPAAITRLMRQHSVQVTMATPSEYLLQLEYHRDVLRQCAAWHLACVGGEPLSEPCRQRFHALRGPRLANFYGPTETSLVCTWRWVDLENDDAERTTAADGDDAGTNVGRPSANTALYIVDADLRLLPVGMPGEVCIAGPGVALGYLDASLSQVRFLEDPWANRRRGGSAGEPSPRLFRTGDRGRLLPDGSLILLGRLGTDNMVKVRGLRIDLDEIATAMLHAAPERISAAVVSVRGEGDARYLVAHVALRPGSVTPDHLDTEADWQELVRGLPLPSYMRPSRIIPLEQLPMDSNRKIDRRAIAAMPLPPLLPSSATSKTSNAVPPRLTLAEGGLRLLWQQILQHPDQPPLEIGPSSDFFVLGGNSNQLVRLQATIERSMACSVPLPRLYSASTLRLMAATIATCQDAANEPASRAMKDDDDDEGTIDWAAETTLPTLPPMDRKTSLVPKAGAHEILFTGASAFLGMAMVRALAEDPRVSRIHCIAVADETASSTLHTIPKVVVYEGTLRHDTLGLTDSQLAQLRAQIDLIIHTGAEGTCVNLYSSLRAANVRPAKWLASLATSLSIPIHYVSHSRVIDFTGRSSFPPASLASYHPPTHDRDGYTPCKWASECIIENWARQTGLPACIHRPCILVGDGAPIDGAIIQYSQRLRASPLFPNFRGRIDVRHVTGVASDIAQACLSTAPALSSPDDRKDSPNITYRHYSSGRSFPASDYRAYIEHLAGEPVVEVSLAEWTKRAMEIGMGVESARFMDWSIKVGKMMTFNYMGEQEL